MMRFIKVILIQVVPLLVRYALLNSDTKKPTKDSLNFFIFCALFILTNVYYNIILLIGTDMLLLDQHDIK